VTHAPRRSRRRFIRCATGGAAALIVAGRAQTARAHPYHTTNAEARVDRSTYTLQVSLRVLPEDLEEALRRSTGQARAVEALDTADLVAYLRRRMIWTHDGGTRMPPRWVGRELAPREVWLHFDHRLPTSARALTLDHRVFFELERDQMNTVRFEGLEGQKTVSLTRHNPRAELHIGRR